MQGRNKIKEENPEIEVEFIQKHKLQQKEEQQRQLHIEMLRVITAQKERTIEPVMQMSQEELCEFFLHYQLMPDSPFELEDFKESERVKLIRNQGRVYFGEVANRQMAGFGICYYKEGKIYQGNFVANKREGLGCEIYKNGNLYIGEFLNNKKHGDGQFFWFHTGDESSASTFFQYYDGQWWGGLPDGKGVMQKANGDIYKGTFKNGLKHGFGSQKFANGDSYKGQYINGLPEGIGEYSWLDGTFYKGDFKQGLRSGYGVWKMSGNEDADKYEGHYCMDKKAGYGEYTWGNGWSFKGNFEHDLRQGYGELFNRNELIFRGQWKKGQKVMPEQPNNIIKLSRLQLKNSLAIKEKEIEVEDICESINKRPVKLDGYGEHQLLARPGFMIRRAKPPNTSRERLLIPKKQKNNLIQSQSTLSSRIGTEIHRPISKISLSSSRNLKSSRLYNQ